MAVNNDAPHVVRSHDVHLDSDYIQWMNDIKLRYRSAQVKAAVRINSEQLLFNWELGRDLVEKKAEETWGTGIVEQVSLDLQNEFPQSKGFSTSNLWYMKKWYLFYSSDDAVAKMKHLSDAINTIPSVHLAQIAEIPNAIKIHQAGGETDSDEKLHQPGGENSFPLVFSFVPWRHHVEIITKCKSVDEAIFYIKKTIQEDWSRHALVNYIKADLYHSSGAAISNFDSTLPASQSKLAQAITKDTYDLGFITVDPEFNELELETALKRDITRFLLELGKGFAYVGSQQEIIASGKARRLDLLFYHIRLRCYVVVELKAKPFEPEFAGKLNFYVNIVDDLVKTPEDNPTIGLLICSDKDQAEVQWAFRGISTPMGVASYENLKINKKVQESLPSGEQIQQQIIRSIEEYELKKKNKDSTSDK